MDSIAQIRLSDYQYPLPPERIAQAPLSQRDQSRLLHFRQGEIQHHLFADLPALLSPQTLLVFNDTRVIQARLFFRRETGALIEILLLHPVEPAEVQLAMQAGSPCRWQCMIGRKKRWKPGEVLRREVRIGAERDQLEVRLVNSEENIVEFRWQNETLHWARLVEALGTLPLPPYIQRDVNEQDQEQYQTVYARHEGAVAAPTAGLHFTERVIDQLRQRGIGREDVTLHVSAGTFMPVKQDEVIQHEMHSEQFLVNRSTLEKLLQAQHTVVAVGTTSMRTLESLYWLGHQLLQQKERPTFPLQLDQDYPYRWNLDELPPLQICVQALLDLLDQHQLMQLRAETRIFIMPGYPFQVCQGLITNYHLPATTLVLLVAAFVGPAWREIYSAALEEGYRFLSYGDSSLLWRTLEANV